MGVDFSITIDSEEFKNYDGEKINYSDTIIQHSTFNIQNNSLLFEEIIIPQNIVCFAWNDTKAFFKTAAADFPFDIFAATFYLLTRYEEYLPHEKDIYGRYAHENSLAFKQGFLQLPVINIWVKEFVKAIQSKFPSFKIQNPKFKIVPTYDIDIAYAYKHKGALRNIGGFFRSPSLERIKVLLGLQQDPFDAYEFMNGLHKKYNSEPVYFFLVAEKNGQYDKNILPYRNNMWRLVKQHAKKYMVALHPSWQSGDRGLLLSKEKQLLESMTELPVTRSRQHYIRFSLPQSYQQLTTAGITDEYSMGYGSINGFRASTASSFSWYDLEKEETTSLRIHPFCFMDANSFYEQKLNPEQAYTEMIHYCDQCREVNGTFISIWHNSFLGTAKEFSGWKEIYERFIAQVQQ